MGNCLNTKFIPLIVYKDVDKKSVDFENTDFEQLEQIATKFLQLAKSFQMMVDVRLQEGRLASADGIEQANIEKIEEGQMQDL